ncbi:Sensor histidine kinase CpxA [Halioglobus japonicus]|nr:Sensor histidine kinase CpxA [Halioglobus japonicus]
MKMRGNLFLRIFLGFWLMSIAILGSWMLASNYFEELPPGHEWGDSKPPGPPHRFLLRTIYSLENQKGAELAATIEEVREKHDIQIYLVSRDGSELLKREIPTAVAKIAEELRAESTRPIVKQPKNHMVAYRIYRPYEGAAAAVFVFPSHRGFILNALGNSLWLRIALAVLISGLVSFALSRLMTNRLKDLRLASRRLANGELDTRLQVREKGGDETDELARDFNTMAEQLQARIQAQKRLLGDVSHELRSPLARLRIALVLAQERPENSAAYMQRIEQEAERLEELIGQLLATQAQGLTLDTHIDLVSLLQQLCTDANFEGQMAGKQFSFSTDTEQAIVDSSGDLLRKSFENILRNALQHTAENTEVSVSLISDNGRYLVSIEDHGTGVPDGDVKTIFDEFYRVDTARTRESGGYGLGLAIARRALLQHGGEITAENTGTGLKITVTLPAMEGQGQQG